MATSTPDWFVFQEQIKDFFVSIGTEAETNIRIQGVRTTHDIDIVVKTRFLGEDLTWLIEAKHWKSKVKKAQVLALRTIMEEIGADRGFIVSTKGFQSGAVEAAKNTNIRLKTFDELKLDSKEFVESEILKSYTKRLTIIEDRYWSHTKKTRIKYGLRHEVTDYPFKFIGQQFLSTAGAAILAASERLYPIDLETFLEEQKGESIARNFQQLINWLNMNLNHFDEKLLVAEWEMHKNNDYHPKGSRTPDGEQTTTQMLAKVIHAHRKS